MNSNLMMLLPLLMSGKKGAFSPDILMKILGAGNGQNGANPMMSLIMSMMSGKQENPQTDSGQSGTKSDPKEFFDKDVLNLLNLLLQINGKSSTSQTQNQT